MRQSVANVYHISEDTRGLQQRCGCGEVRAPRSLRPARLCALFNSLLKPGCEPFGQDFLPEPLNSNHIVPERCKTCTTPLRLQRRCGECARASPPPPRQVASPPSSASLPSGWMQGRRRREAVFKAPTLSLPPPPLSLLLSLYLSLSLSHSLPRSLCLPLSPSLSLSLSLSARASWRTPRLTLALSVLVANVIRAGT